jgi:hypothetical protein
MAISHGAAPASATDGRWRSRSWGDGRARARRQVAGAGRADVGAADAGGRGWWLGPDPGLPRPGVADSASHREEDAAPADRPGRYRVGVGIFSCWPVWRAPTTVGFQALTVARGTPNQLAMLNRLSPLRTT